MSVNLACWYIMLVGMKDLKNIQIIGRMKVYLTLLIKLHLSQNQ